MLVPRNLNRNRNLFFCVGALWVVAFAPALAALTPAQQQYIIEKAKLEKLKGIAHQANPRLKWTEDQAAALQARMKKKQEETRVAIDQYLAEHKLSHENLAKYRLDEITSLFMRINPSIAVSDPKLKEITLGALRKGQPVNPEVFAKKFPGKKAAEVPGDQLLAYHQEQLKIEADKARAKLAPLIKESGAPEFMIQAMNEITVMKCVLTLLRGYLDACTPLELSAQQALVTRMERRAAGK